MWVRFLEKMTQHAMPPEFGRKWETECLDTRFSLPTLLCVGYSVTLIFFLIQWALHHLCTAGNLHSSHLHGSDIMSLCHSLETGIIVQIEQPSWHGTFFFNTRLNIKARGHASSYSHAAWVISVKRHYSLQQILHNSVKLLFQVLKSTKALRTSWHNITIADCKYDRYKFDF